MDNIQTKKHLPHDFFAATRNKPFWEYTGYFWVSLMQQSHSGIATNKDPRIKFGRSLSMTLGFGIPCSIRIFFSSMTAFRHFWQDRAWIFVMCKSYCNSIHSIFLGYGKVWLQSDISFQPRMVGLGGRTIPLIEAVLHGCSFFLSIMKKRANEKTEV